MKDTIIHADTWTIVEPAYDPARRHHGETVFTIGNGYLGTRGAFEERYVDEMRATFVHGVFDDTPVVFTELANAPDWLELDIWLEGERFDLSTGGLLAYKRTLDLRTGLVRREVEWRSPAGRTTRLVFERFASLAEQHLCAVQVAVTPIDYSGRIEIRSGIDGEVDNLALKHWTWVEQGLRGSDAWLSTRTRATRIELAVAIHLDLSTARRRARVARWDVRNHPTLSAALEVSQGDTATALKWAALYTSRDGRDPLKSARKALRRAAAGTWASAVDANARAWAAEWNRCDVQIDGDDEAQVAVRYNLFQLLIAAPRQDEQVNLGAKTLSGYGYRGHAFWDTEIFMLPFFTYTRPEIARQLLSYRWHRLPGARAKATGNGYAGAQFPWESAATGEEVTPTWVPDAADRTKLIRIWTGDIEIHISADIAYAVWQYWRATGDEPFLLERGAEIILETARFWASRAEWKAEQGRYEISDIVGPDEYHDHVDNNAYTNALARWNLQLAAGLEEWLQAERPLAWRKLNRRVRVAAKEVAHWRQVAERMYVPFDPVTRLIEQFQGYFQRTDVDLLALEPRNQSVQQLLGIDGVNQTQVLKQPDVLMLMYLLPDLYDVPTVRANYVYYTARTDHTHGSSLGPSIQAIMACRMNDAAAYEHFMRAARADLYDVRHNAGDGIHGASAGGLWQAVVFGFAGLTRVGDTWVTRPQLPERWKRVSFKVIDHGVERTFVVERVAA